VNVCIYRSFLVYKCVEAIEDSAETIAPTVKFAVLPRRSHIGSWHDYELEVECVSR